MVVLKSFIFALLITGFFTRVANWYYLKKFKKETVIYLSSVTVGFPLVVIMAFVVGWDLAISKYLFSLLAWFLFDLLRSKVKEKKNE